MNRKHICKAVCFIIVIMMCTACTVSKDWELVRKTNITVDDYSAGAPGTSLAGFEDVDNGIAVGHHSDIRYTQDGGDEWIEAETPLASVGLDSLYIGNGGNAWTSGGYQLRRSKDGGRTWTELPNYSSLYSAGHYLSFADDSTGWYAIGERTGSSPGLSITRDGGMSWSGVQIPEYARESIMGADLISETTGVLLLKDGSLTRTDNGGKSWRRITLPVNGRPMLTENPGSAVEAVRFSNINEGTVILYFVKPRGFVTFDTVDGGIKWTESRLPEKAEVKLGNIYLSRSRKYLTIYDLDRETIVLYRRR